MKILVPVDGSEFSRRLLGWLSANEEWLGGGHSLTLLHVAPPLPPRPAAVLDKQLVKDYYSELSQKVFKPMRTFFAKKSLNVRFQALVGVAGEVIATQAQKGGFDLVIMGSHGHGALMNVVTGSVATQVLARCKVPVLLIR